MLELNQLYLMDCMDGMKQFPDKYFNLAIVDPPYELERFKHGSLRIDKTEKAKNGLKWDIAPTQEYFNELFRVSETQIIWGANNFNLPKTEYFIVWDKQQSVDNFASAEYAWTNCKVPAKVFRYSIHQVMADRKADGGKIHPTQKPVKLYEWLLSKYAKHGDKILDTHVGSASSLIACHNLHYEYIGFEIDKDYYEAAQERLQAHMAQQRLF
ncbi:MAG TPA: DNA methyltransferase [Smithellaceae bacterium]|nr:DNA methyltransferase [Smithellaceae bacterium]